MITAIWLADPPGATLVILDNLDWYCDIANISFAYDKFIKSQEIIVIKIEESLHFVVKIRLYYFVCSSAIMDSDYRLCIFKLVRRLLSVNCSKSGYECISYNMFKNWTYFLSKHIHGSNNTVFIFRLSLFHLQSGTVIDIDLLK